MPNSQLNNDGDLKEAVATIRKEDLPLFPIKQLVAERQGIQTWLVSFKGIHISVKKPSSPNRHAGGDQQYLNS